MRSVVRTCGHQVPDPCNANGQLHRTPSGFGAFGVVSRKIYFFLGEKSFSIKRKQSFPYTNRSTIVGNAVAHPQVGEEASGTRGLGRGKSTL